MIPEVPKPSLESWHGEEERGTKERTLSELSSALAMERDLGGFRSAVKMLDSEGI
jgi:hypothetical protein